LPLAITANLNSFCFRNVPTLSRGLGSYRRTVSRRRRHQFSMAKQSFCSSEHRHRSYRSAELDLNYLAGLRAACGDQRCRDLPTWSSIGAFPLAEASQWLQHQKDQSDPDARRMLAAVLSTELAGLPSTNPTVDVEKGFLDSAAECRWTVYGALCPLILPIQKLREHRPPNDRWNYRRVCS